MSRRAHVPRELARVPFRGADAVRRGVLTTAMLRGRAWQRLLPDIYLHREATLDHRTWCAAVALRLPRGAAIASQSAAYLWGIDLLPADAAVTVAHTRAAQLTPHPRLRLRSTLLPGDERTTHSGIPVTTPLRTAFDLGRHLPFREAVVALDALLHRRLLHVAELTALVGARPGWPGTTALRRACAESEPLAESPMETRLRLLLIRGGLPRPVAQHRVGDERGPIARVDLAYPQARLAIEYEGDHHRDRATFRRDIARVNALRALGWTVLRLTADDVLRHPSHTVHQVRNLLSR